MPMDLLPVIRPHRIAWNKGRIIGQKRPLQPKHVWSIRVPLEMADNPRDLALFNMAIDSKLRGCDLVRLAALARDVPRQKPTSGAVFAFRGRRGDRLKLLYWDGQGFRLSYKVLGKGRFPWPATGDGACRMIYPTE